MLKFSNSYAELGEAFYQRLQPTPVAQPQLLLWNRALAEQLQIPEPLLSDTHLQAGIFSGNKVPSGADAMALAYCGHQFGQLNPQLGDGRAHLLGEVLDQKNQRRDIQLKGSGPTPFSRGGDGRCALGPALREYIMSEAMHFLGVPTSRCLAVVSTGEPVYREQKQAGAVVTRVASSHIRVGTFQYFAIRQDHESLKKLVDYSIERHYPHILEQAEHSADRTLLLLQAIIDKQLKLVVEWMRVGFIHGVMNTDNCAISGETIDYGPCAMMGIYDPGTVYSSIDRQGRYAYGNQPNIILWNMARLAECLLPLLAEQEEAAIEKAKSVLEQYPAQFEQAYFQMLGNKLGLPELTKTEGSFVTALLQAMQKGQMDYTQTFVEIGQSLEDKTLAESLQNQLGEAYQQWREQLRQSAISIETAKATMSRYNPLVIPRNHDIENVLESCEASGSVESAEDILTVLRSPYQEIAATRRYQQLPADGDKGYQTFCGT